MDEITQTHAGWTEKSKMSVFAISGIPKIHPTHKHSNTCHGLIFHHNFFFECSKQCPLSEAITIEITKKR